MSHSTIVAAAIKSDYDGLIYHVPKPGRHSDVIFMLAEQGLPTPITGEQGFITSKGSFVDRHLALSIAYLAKQITQEQYNKAKESTYELFSEDVWQGHFYDHYLEQFRLYRNSARQYLLASQYTNTDWCLERARNIYLYKLSQEYREKAIKL